MTPEKNLELMKTLDDSWNSQDLTVFRKRHTKNCIVRWPNQPPTHGIEAHQQEAIAFFQTFPDQHLINNPYKVMIAQGDWTCTIAEFTGTMKGPMKMADGSSIPPTNKTFKVDFCTVAHWNENGEIVEENLFYDLMGMLKQNRSSARQGPGKSRVRARSYLTDQEGQAKGSRQPSHLPAESKILPIPSIHAESAVLVARAAD